MVLDSSREDECNRLAFYACNLAQVLEVLKEVGGVVCLRNGDLEAVRSCTGKTKAPVIA